ncbi:phospholipid-transporting ATPase IK isoform X4 [Aphelocoma coerulescens]|uniref:phospholipid-transporting ATPase IK isoform X4 n=1 Tax=Aphelocoma coerulescens TaxID=39617 RepID=UPI0036050FCB
MGCPALEPWEAGASQWDHAVTAQCFKCLWLSLSPGPGSGASMAEQDPATGCPRGKQQLPAFTWEVRANDHGYHRQFKKKFAFCLSKRKYSGNAIRTAKYNLLTFLPLNLYEQFHRMANVYFVFVILLQTFPEISTLPWYTLLFPLSCLLIIRGLRDLIDDIGRHQSDRNINSRPCEILAGTSFHWQKWRDICVGDIVRLRKDSVVPADLLLLRSSEPSSLCYVETADIDGETNLKFRQALLVTHQELGSEESMAAFDGRVTCEEPNSRMHTFTGTLRWQGRAHALDIDRLLLRGCRVRNTALCYGLVLYAGFDSKIMRNCGKIKRKKTKLDHMMDRLVVMIFLVLLLTSLGLAVASGFWARTFQEKHSYLAALYKHTTPAQQAFLNFWGFTILLSIIIPMSMYITLEFIYLLNSCFINWDLEMYYGAKDIPAEARSTSLSDQLGQVEYIFSDKTGTLTQNIMSFKKCCVNGTIYGPGTGHENKQPPGSGLSWEHPGEQKSDVCDVALLEAAQRDDDPVLREFLRLLALCHTVMVEDRGDQLVYQAASPDEEALVLAAKNLGYVFLARTQDTITIRELGSTRTYEVLAMLDFNSDRKRMSVLALCRGDAEDAVRGQQGGERGRVPRLEPEAPRGHGAAAGLRAGAGQALRGDGAEPAAARGHGHRGQAARRSPRDHPAAETGQHQSVGADRRQTRLLTDDMEILEEKEVSEILQLYWESNNNLSGSGDAPCSRHLSQQRPEAPCHQRAIIISGDFLDKILHTGEVLKEKKGWPWRWLCCDRAEASQDQGGLVEKAFVELATSCQAMICCRVTPKQKALMVQLVKKHKKAVTLAIGDGANDVNMIKTADIGVGISGLEGLQAVQCSDYALAQFSFLQRLLLVHGRWNYLRICKFLRYFFYKTFAGLLAQVWFAFHSGFTAQPLYEGWFLALYNIFYTAYPVLSVGLLEQDVSAKKSLEFPELYTVGQQDELFNYRVFGVTLLHGVGTSLISFYVAFWAFEDRVGTKAVGDYESFSVTVALSALLSVLVEIILDTKYWTVLSFLMVTASLLLYCLFSFLTQSVDAFRIAPAIFRFPDASWNALTDPYVLLVVLLSLVVNTLPSLTVHAFRATLGRATTQQKIHLKAKRDPEPSVELRSHVPRGSLRRRSSYAFSHQEGYAGLITRGDSLRARATAGTAPAALRPEETLAVSSLP